MPRPDAEAGRSRRASLKRTCPRAFCSGGACAPICVGTRNRPAVRFVCAGLARTRRGGESDDQATQLGDQCLSPPDGAIERSEERPHEAGETALASRFAQVRAATLLLTTPLSAED